MSILKDEIDKIYLKKNHNKNLKKKRKQNIVESGLLL